MTRLALALSLNVPASVRGGGAPVAAIVISASTTPENSTAGTTVGTLSTVLTTGTAVFSLVDNAGSRFALSGAIIQRGATALDYETSTYHNIVVGVTGVTPTISNTTLTINVTNIAELPVISTPPTLSPTSGAVGTLITCGTGSWTNSPTSYAYQWMKGGVDISGATSSTYTSVLADDTLVLTCKVLASNADGPASGYSTTSNSHTVGVSAWTPASLGSALRVWLKADVGITLNTTFVAAWADQSGQTIDFTQATGGFQPTYAATGFNGLPTVSFVASGPNLVTSAADDVFNIGTVSSWFFVGQMHTETASYGRIFSYRSTGSIAGVGDYDGPGKMAVLSRAASTNAIGGFYNSTPTNSQAISLATNYRLGVIFDGANYTPYVNNTAGTTTAIAPNFGGVGGRLQIGDQLGGASGPFDGFISEVVITNTALSSGDRLSLDNYFKTKWGLS